MKDGSVIKSLHELEAKLKDMDEETFAHHVGEDKNDFKNWIEHIIDDEKLAAKLSRFRTKNDMIRLVELRVRQLERARNVEDMISSAKERIARRKEGSGEHTHHRQPPHEKSPAHEHLIHNLKDFTEGIILGVVIGIIIGRALI
jgi:hypothetical protein